MSKSNKQHVVSTTANQSARVQSIDYTALDTFRREMIQKEEESNRTWKAKYDPWLINGYQQMYDNVFKMRNKSSSIHVSSLQRPEWQQPIDILPPITKRLPGQRRRRILGSFPQTENDKIGWRLLPEQAIDIYGSNSANIPPLPSRYKFSSCPVESFS